jgi:ABC-type multidrug transport system ATPase subunit
MPPPAIQIENLVKYFPPARCGWRALTQPFARASERALDGVSFSAENGEAVAVVGHNGAGKSTLLRILVALIVPTSGSARICGFDVERQGAEVRRQIGYHTGDEGFYGRLSGRENLQFFAAMNNLAGSQARERISSVTEWMGLSADLDRQVRTYSTGMTHRLGLARALLHGPSVLLLDEPTRSLDPLAAADFRRLLKDDLVRQRGTSLLFASHSLSEVEEIADRVVLLDHGRAIACDSPRGLHEATRSPTLEAAIASIVHSAGGNSRQALSQVDRSPGAEAFR